MQRDEMIAWLEHEGAQSRAPIWTFSYNRAGTAPFLNRMAQFQHREEIHVVVRASQVEAYTRAYPWANLYPVPDHLDCVGYSRQTALSMAALQEHELIVLVDDDLINTSFLFQGYVKGGPNQGDPVSARYLLRDTEHLPYSLPEMVLTGISAVSRRVMADDPLAVLGGGVKQHGAFGENLHRTMYRLNGGVTPKQLMAAAPVRLADAGVSLNVGLFGRHGDDIGLIAEILRAGLKCWAMPSFVYDVWSEEQNIRKSVVRNADTAPALHAEEWDALQQYPIRDHLRVKRNKETEEFEWADVNWQQYAKQTGVKPATVLWPEDEARELI